MKEFKYLKLKNITLKEVKENNTNLYYDLQGNQVQPESIEELQTTQEFDTLSEDNSDTITFLSNLIKESVSFRNEEEYSILSSFVLLSYTYDLFEKVPYCWLHASKGSGKTTTLKCLSKLVRKPVLTSSITGPSLFRIIDSESPTLILDEVEELKKRNSTAETIIKILNSGYEKSGNMMLTENLEPKQFKTYSVKILAGINELFDTVKDRCIKVKLVKATTGFENKNTLDNNRTKILELLANRIDDKISELCDIIKNPSLLELSDKFINRSLDKWFPILSIIKVYGNSDLYDYLKIHAEDEINESLQDEMNSLENVTKSIIDEFYKENVLRSELNLNGRLYFNTKMLVDYFDENQPYKLFRNQSEFTTYLKNLNVFTDRRRYNNKVTSFYTFSIKDFQHLKLMTSEKKAS